MLPSSDTSLSGANATNYPLTAAAFTTASAPTRERDREMLSMQLVMQQIKLDNENLRKQLVNIKENSECYR